MAQGMLQRTLRDLLQETEDAISSGRVEAALAHCQSILTSFPESLEAHRLLGEVYLAQGQLEEALHSFDWVLTNDPENVIAYCNRALVSERMSDYDTALDCYQQAYELSRGNSQIRQEFNQLSKKAGQQGFMFSRAGLARLYMRGDLLPQALHEWDTVLAASPDRLDARTGLLEACWRENAFERASQIATQILQEVPGCVKALLLLAHITAPRDTVRAQEFLHKAEALDPDLVMAQELFADLMASRPDDVFFRLLRKAPAVVGTASSSAAGANSAPLASSVSGVGLTTSGTDFSFGNDNGNTSLDPLAQWADLDSWGTDTTLVKPKTNDHSGADLTAYKDVFSAWTMNDSSQSTPGIPSSIPISQTSLSGLDTSEQFGADVSPFASWNLEPHIQPVPSASGKPEPWQLLEEALNDMSGLEASSSFAPSEPLLWNTSTPPLGTSGSSDQWAIPTGNDVPSLSDWNGSAEASAASLNTLQPAADESASATPAWLSMLTQADRRPTNSSLPAVEPESAEEEVPAPASTPLAATPTPAPASTPVLPWEQSEENQDLEEGDEELLFGPAWLKSLGATMLDDAIPAESAPSALESVEPPQRIEPDVSKGSEPTLVLPQPQVPEQSEPAEADFFLPVGKVQESSTIYVPWQDEPASATPPPMVPEPGYEPWQNVSVAAEQPAQLPITNSLSPAAQDEIQPATFEAWKPFETESASADKIESNLLTTLEELEVQLRAKGFLPLEPNSLASIAQSSGVDSADEPETSQGPAQKPEEQPWSEPTRSSALAELGSIAKPTLVDVDPIETPAEPQWLRDLRSTPTPAPAARGLDVPQEPVQNPYLVGQHYEAPELDTFFTAPATPSQPASIPSIAPAASMAFEPAPVREPQIDLVPIPKTNPFLENELETTMRRPAVRLQSLQQRSTIGRGESSGGLISRSRQPVERKEPVVNKIDTASNGSLSYKDRLLKGYQHQLVGSYDDAMQEYRIIIRSAPELLGEVVSNVRALLRIAPRYSAGYRVLGDAYMRQGEYLQAMESYNRALTMAKKGKQA